MTHQNPLHPLHEQAQASFITYGSTNKLAENSNQPGPPAVQVVQTFGQYEAEYAAIRKGVAILDMPQRGLVEVAGGDRAQFLHRIMTNDTANLQPGQGRRAFMLSKPGRVTADMVVLHGKDNTYLVLDRFDVLHLVSELDKYLFSEDVQFNNRTDQYVQLALHGPASAALLANASGETLADLNALDHVELQLADQDCRVCRCDDTGVPGFHLLIPHDTSVQVYQHLCHTSVSDENTPRYATPIGWLAYNTARIEAGQPIYHIDFGPDNLPHETSVIDEAVSFTKGCYLGQEIVARMQNLGHPKKILVGLKFDDDDLPVAGSQVVDTTSTSTDESDPQVVGAITSSTNSPMLGNKAIAFAMIKWGKHQQNHQLAVQTDTRLSPATVHSLAFL